MTPSADLIENAPTRAVQATLLLTATLSVMAGAIISPSLPALQEHFAATPRVNYLARFIDDQAAYGIADCQARHAVAQRRNVTR